MEKQREGEVISAAEEHSGHSTPRHGGKGPWKPRLCVGQLLPRADTVPAQLLESPWDRCRNVGQGTEERRAWSGHNVACGSVPLAPAPRGARQGRRAEGTASSQ